LVFVLSGSVLLGVSFGQAAGEVVPNFPMKHRYTGSELTADLAWLFGAGFAPWLALALASCFGLKFAGGFLLSGAVCTLIALFASRPVAQER
jgi:hypothetical protein